MQELADKMLEDEQAMECSVCMDAGGLSLPLSPPFRNPTPHPPLRTLGHGQQGAGEGDVDSDVTKRPSSSACQTGWRRVTCRLVKFARLPLRGGEWRRRRWSLECQGRRSEVRRGGGLFLSLALSRSLSLFLSLSWVSNDRNSSYIRESSRPTAASSLFQEQQASIAAAQIWRPVQDLNRSYYRRCAPDKKHATLTANLIKVVAACSDQQLSSPSLGPWDIPCKRGSTPRPPK